MSLINCPECNKEISDKAEFCPNCGSTGTPKGRLAKGVIGTIGTIKLIFLSLVELVIISLLFIFDSNKLAWFCIFIVLLTWWLWIKSVKKM